MKKKIERKCCINCSADLTLASTKNKSAFYILNCSSRVRAPLSPASFDLIPVHRALATIFNFEILEKVAKVSVSDHLDTDDESEAGLKNENPFKEFQSSASTVPICYVCYLVLSDLYRNYIEFSQLGKRDSFLGLKLKELESQLISHRPQQNQQSSSTSDPIPNPNPNEVPDSNQDGNRNRTNTLRNLDVGHASSKARNVKVTVNSNSTTALGHIDDLDSNINCLLRPTKLKRQRAASRSHPVQEKRLLRSAGMGKAVVVGTALPSLQTKNVKNANFLIQQPKSKKAKFGFSRNQVRSNNVDKITKEPEMQNAMIHLNLEVQTLIQDCDSNPTDTPRNPKVLVTVISRCASCLCNNNFPVRSYFVNCDFLKWKSLSCGGLKRRSHAAVAVNGIIYSFGGFDANYSEKNPSNPIEVHVLNTLESSLKWKLFPAKTNAFTPSSRSGHTVVACKHLIYLWGGRFCNNKVYVFNTETMEWVKCEVKEEVPTSRDFHTATLVRNKMYVFGGYDSGTDACNSMKCLDLESLTWSSISPKNDPPTPRTGHSATVEGDRFIYIFGGWEKRKRNCNLLVCFDVETNEWSFPEVTGTIPDPQMHQCAFTHNGFMYIFGGWGDSGTLNDLFCYDLKTMEWKEMFPSGPCPYRRFAAQSAVIKNQVFIFGGFNGGTRDDTVVLTID